QRRIDDQNDLGRLAETKPDDRQSDERDRRNKSEKFHIGINEGADDLAPAHEQAERNSDTRTDEIPDDDPPQPAPDLFHQLTVADEFDRAVERRARRRKKRWLADPPGQYRPDNERADQRGAKGDIVRHRVIIPSPSLARGLDADLGHFRHGICLMALVTSS